MKPSTHDMYMMGLNLNKALLYLRLGYAMSARRKKRISQVMTRHYRRMGFVT